MYKTYRNYYIIHVNNVVDKKSEVNMNMKEFKNSTIYATEDRLDDETKLISITTRPIFNHRIYEWRNDKSYETAWNFIADQILEQIDKNIECDIDDNYLRVFYNTDEQLNKIYDLIEKNIVKIDDFFI